MCIDVISLFYFPAFFCVASTVKIENENNRFFRLVTKIAVLFMLLTVFVSYLRTYLSDQTEIVCKTYDFRFCNRKCTHMFQSILMHKHCCL